MSSEDWRSDPRINQLDSDAREEFNSKIAPLAKEWMSRGNTLTIDHLRTIFMAGFSEGVYQATILLQKQVEWNDTD